MNISDMHIGRHAKAIEVKTVRQSFAAGISRRGDMANQHTDDQGMRQLIRK